MQVLHEQNNIRSFQELQIRELPLRSLDQNIRFKETCTCNIGTDLHLHGIKLNMLSIYKLQNEDTLYFKTDRIKRQLIII